MRFASFESDGDECWGRVEGDHIVPLHTIYPTLKSAIEADALQTRELIEGGGDPLSLDQVSFLPVVTRPGKILCVGLNYEDHRLETGRPDVKYPTIFTRFADSQTSHGAPLMRPRESEKFDYEGELAIVIGKGGRRIAAADAYDHIAGYSCYNDGSVRDWQSHTIQFGPGKNFPLTGAFGPWLVTPDEFGRPNSQKIQTRLNGAVMQEAVFADMIFAVDRLIEYCSTFTPLAPGDVIVTGTPGGVGAKRNPPVFMKPGDRVEVEIDGIGILSNSIADD